MQRCQELFDDRSLRLVVDKECVVPGARLKLDMLVGSANPL